MPDRPRIFAALVWFDEPPAELAATIDSVAGFVDTVVALDGAYRTFPHGGSPASDQEQHATIEAACRRHGLGLIMPAGREYPSQCVKRTTAFGLVEQLARPYVDLVLVIDADERIEHLDEAAVLAGMARADVGLVDVVTTDPTIGAPRRAPGVQPPTSTDDTPRIFPRLFRVQRSIQVGPTYHWTYTATDQRGERVVLKGAQTLPVPLRKAPTVDLRAHLRLTNGTWDRPAHRLAQKTQYGRERWRHGIDL